jgi:hypothetical protein
VRVLRHTAASAASPWRFGGIRVVELIRSAGARHFDLPTTGVGRDDFANRSVCR